MAWNGLIATLHSDCKVYLKVSKVIASLLKLLLSAKLWTGAVTTKNQKLFKNKLNKGRLITESWGATDTIFCILLLPLFIHTKYFQNYWSYLAHFLSPSSKDKKIYLEKNSLYFGKWNFLALVLNFFLYFGKRKPLKNYLYFRKRKPSKVCYISGNGTFRPKLEK